MGLIADHARRPLLQTQQTTDTDLQAAHGSASSKVGIAIVKRTKYILASVIGVLTVIVVLHNIQPVETRILFITLTMPRAFLLAGTLAVGFLLGFVMGRR